MRVQKWEPEKHKKAGASQPKAFEIMSLLVVLCWEYQRVDGQQLDHDEEMGPMHGMYGTLDTKLEVQCTNKRAALTAFLCFLMKTCGPTMVHVDNKRVMNGLWKGEVKCICPTAKYADLWIVI